MDTQLITDHEQIGQILKGDKKAFQNLYQKYVRLHMLICLRYMRRREDAEDLLQESYIQIFKKLNQFDPKKGEYKSWSKKIVINTCLQQLRKNNIVDTVDNIIDIATNSEVINPSAIDQLNLKELVTLITKLPKGYRTVFNLYVVDGFSHKEIAEQLNISESTSKTQLFKARKMLQEMIEKNESRLNIKYAI